MHGFQLTRLERRVLHHYALRDAEPKRVASLRGGLRLTQQRQHATAATTAAAAREQA